MLNGASHSPRSACQGAAGSMPAAPCFPCCAKRLMVSLEELFGEGQQAGRSKRGPVPKWQQQIEAISQLPKARQRFVSQMLETVLTQH
jgi:hypothetical protein